MYPCQDPDHHGRNAINRYRGGPRYQGSGSTVTEAEDDRSLTEELTELTDLTELTELTTAISLVLACLGRRAVRSDGRAI